MLTIMDDNIKSLNEAFIKATTEVTVDRISGKIRQIKTNHDLRKQITEYDQLINDLLGNKNDLERISREYKSRLERVVISDEDIESLHNTVVNVIQVVKDFSDKENDESSENSLDTLVNLLNADTLRTLQLLGYNYKKAIGEPLTKITADYISNFGEAYNKK